MSRSGEERSPELKRVYCMWERVLSDRGSDLTNMRDTVEEFYRANFHLAEDVEVEAVFTPVPGLWITTPAGRSRSILYFHGGGYALGSPRAHAEMASWIARAAQARVFVLDYRRAPEYRFPAALEDAMLAYRSVVNSGADPRAIAVAGDSAGGGLTLALLTWLRDRGEPLPSSAVCISPWVDLEMTGESIGSRAALDPLLTREGLQQFADWYLGGQDARNPLVSPLHADLQGLPPLLIQVGTSEILLDDALRLAERARVAGVNVTLSKYEDMPHVWHVFASFLPEARQADREIGEFVMRHSRRAAAATQAAPPR
ncbi:MAG TPA: alpha/beta hydrolase [Terriglobales bacterium]|nr:alpha/beta hydrolase [Terriglobales bacterium]